MRPPVARTLRLMIERLRRRGVELIEDRLQRMSGNTAVLVDVVDEGCVVGFEVAGVAVLGSGADGAVGGGCVALVRYADEQRRITGRHRATATACAPQPARARQVALR